MDQQMLGAYLRRMDVSRPAVLDAAALRALHRAHLCTVPFENLDIHFGRPISLDAGDLLAKVVTARRGGFCYELNGAFALLLEALGAEVDRVAAKVYRPDRLGPLFDHLALIVRLPDGSPPWLADVGFGSHSTYPLLLDERAEQDDPGGRFRLADAAEGDVDVYLNGEPQYRLERRARPLADFAPTCWWQETWPESHFREGTVCSLLTEDGRISIAGRTLITTVGAERTEEKLATDEALLAAYRDLFGISLDRVPPGP
jgi:N-hydroxyarylamine O-acetyltransferase